MQNLNLNEIPSLIQGGKLTRKQAVDYLAVFLAKNKRIFGLHNEDEDFLNDVILSFLERSDKLLDHYQPELGSFFNYFFVSVKSHITLQKRRQKNDRARESFALKECIKQYKTETPCCEYGSSQDSALYAQENRAESFVAGSTEAYSASPPDFSGHQLSEKLKKIQLRLKGIPEARARKIMLLLTLKSAYYINDEQLHLVSSFCRVDEDKLYETIFTLRSEFHRKAEKNRIYTERINTAYFFYQKFQDFNRWAEEQQEENLEYFQMDIEKRCRVQKERFLRLTGEAGKRPYARPTTQAIAKIVGMSVRQVNYYFHQAKKIGIAIDE